MSEEQECENSQFPALQGNEEELVGYGLPPKKYQFKPGQSGNPKGQPKARCFLWRWVCTYMNMTEAEIDELEKEKLTLVQKSAIEIAKNMAAGKSSEYLAKHFFDREEGKAVEHVVMDNQQEPPTPEECENVRRIMRNNFNKHNGKSDHADSTGPTDSEVRHEDTDV